MQRRRRPPPPVSQLPEGCGGGGGGRSGSEEVEVQFSAGRLGSAAAVSAVVAAARSTEEEEERLEREHFWKIINAFRYYGDSYRFLLVDSLIKGNGKIMPASTFDMDKLKSTLKQFVRDWSETGKAERDACYQPIIKEILKNFPKERCPPSLKTMEFKDEKELCSEINKYKLYPWIHQFSNNRRSADQIRPIFFPDVDPHSLPPGSNFSMTAGDFQEIYSECSKSKEERAVRLMTRKDFIQQGFEAWLKLELEGPLLYHFENLANELSIELSYEDIKNVVLQYGFQIEVEEESVLSTYTVNDLSMMKYYYECVLFVVRKPQ
ncbi:PREDICTED: UPF0586 protein C9orf41 homolog [Propithecus coquereli]|uniref:UPF0586 protein C9orf41 homolog n=1 Tax=Propithecus coquereli TaxID=379532 RepID=UPI00063F83B1|nr:PREDICTED: UPF0586 protein C9orf41 homolog [Propithecus coquereli]